DDLDQIEAQIPITLCKLEKVFPPSLFDVMVHLPTHLANEAKLTGPVQYRWMYPIERWLYFLKPLIGNRACPEGSIAEGYLANECMTLCSRYLHRIDTKFSRPERNYDGGLRNSDGGLSLFCKSGKTLGAPKQHDLEADELEQAHIYIQKNCDEVLPFLEEFAQIHVDSTQHLSDTEWNRQFIEWFKDRVAQLYKGDNSQLMEDLLVLSRGPTQYVLHYNGYIVNGYRFHVEDYDKHLRTQNCGVVVVGETGEHSKNIDYYGVLTDVVELQFTGRRVILFQCNWFDMYDKKKGIKTDEYGIVSVNWGRFLKTSEPFNENEVASTVKATAKYAFVAPGAIGKGRGRGLKSICSLGVRGSNKCKEVASLEVGEKLKVTFYNNRTVGKNSNLFSRHLGKIVRDRNICPLGVASWDRIKEEKLNHMWAAVTDKFESDDMDIHRNHILGWMKELWNKRRGQLHANYVKGKPIQEALKNVPKGVDKKQWEWLVKEHFATESFQARSNRNAANRTKLKMLHHIGSKPIREIIYQKGGKDGKPPDLATIFFETRKKNNIL
ncbi:hypothetical protein A4A49_62140, partial [Nicotiana attenuata]